MGIRKKSGNIFAGSLLNVDGQGIYTVKKFQLTLDKSKKSFILESTPTPTLTYPVVTAIPTTPIVGPTPTPTPTLEPTPTPTPTLEPTPTPTPTLEPTPTPTPTPCPSTPTYYVTAQDDMLRNGQRIFLLSDFDFNAVTAATCDITINYVYLTVPTTASTPTTATYHTNQTILSAGQSSIFIHIEEYFYDFYITSVSSCSCETIQVWDHRIVTVGSSTANENILGYHVKPNQAADNWFTGYTSSGAKLATLSSKQVSVATDGSGNWLCVGEGERAVLQNTYVGLTALWDYITPGFDTQFASVEWGYDDGGNDLWLLSTLNTKEIVFSNDLINWSNTPSGLSYPIKDFANGKDSALHNLWVGVSRDDGSNNIIISSDGYSWQFGSAGKNNLEGVAYNQSGNTWMVVGVNTLFSTNGSTFNLTSSQPGFATTAYGVTYSPKLGLWCVVGDYGTDNIFVSNNSGNTWTGTTLNPSTGSTYFDVTWDGYNFIAMGSATNNKNIIFSNDGFNWYQSSNGSQVLYDGLGVASVRAPGLYPPR